MADLLSLGDPALMELATPAQKAMLGAAARRTRYGDGALIHSRGDDSPGLSIINKGAVRFVKYARDGGNVIVSTLGPGHSFGEATLFAGMGRAYDAVAVGQTEISQISKTKIERLLDAEPALARLLLATTTRRLYSALGFLDDLRSLSLPGRTAKLIDGMLATAKSPDRVVCLQSDIAFTLGVSRVSIGKALSRLQEEGVIELGYGEICVPDRKALKQWIAEMTD